MTTGDAGPEHKRATRNQRMARANKRLKVQVQKLDTDSVDLENFAIDLLALLDARLSLTAIPAEITARRRALNFPMPGEID